MRRLGEMKDIAIEQPDDSGPPPLEPPITRIYCDRDMRWKLVPDYPPRMDGRPNTSRWKDETPMFTYTSQYTYGNQYYKEYLFMETEEPKCRHVYPEESSEMRAITYRSRDQRHYTITICDRLSNLPKSTLLDFYDGEYLDHALSNPSSLGPNTIMSLTILYQLLLTSGFYMFRDSQDLTWSQCVQLETTFALRNVQNYGINEGYIVYLAMLVMTREFGIMLDDRGNDGYVRHGVLIKTQENPVQGESWDAEPPPYEEE
ncbi:hypothetical protein EJ05DRAFT_487331 [Pseudovirgaria hyperparasitica]|uniref:Uncharacterized protein n=1 Tax=Pseudovirgaria hyperparasitica TaxID=470096 RepID=A0A6A6W1L4_9PEZI|nr:uncharacterized protein EJ05DRAFT_487331 [Pseudovirgaria hyperparasitica]KAF2756425.1 hypothetical protein EJ05DRAFT_487331 [Pseudovirgaria hyperparasitica]